MFLEISQISMARLWHGCFPVNFVKFLRTPFLQNTSGRLLLEYINLLCVKQVTMLAVVQTSSIMYFKQSYFSDSDGNPYVYRLVFKLLVFN